MKIKIKFKLGVDETRREVYTLKIATKKMFQFLCTIQYKILPIGFIYMM